MTAALASIGSVRRKLRSVVLPAPRNPVSTETGSRAFGSKAVMAARYSMRPARSHPTDRQLTSSRFGLLALLMRRRRRVTPLRDGRSLLGLGCDSGEAGEGLGRHHLAVDLLLREERAQRHGCALVKAPQHRAEELARGILDDAARAALQHLARAEQVPPQCGVGIEGRVVAAERNPPAREGVGARH